jgi:hypothetical protein
MGESRRRGNKEQRIILAIENRSKTKKVNEKKRDRFIYLCKLIKPNATNRSIIDAGRRRNIDMDGHGLTLAPNINTAEPLLYMQTFALLSACLGTRRFYD